eukprot:2613555-Lingulodinium_polyedra.AAC.1
MARATRARTRASAFNVRIRLCDADAATTLPNNPIRLRNNPMVSALRHHTRAGYTNACDTRGP